MIDSLMSVWKMRSEAISLVYLTNIYFVDSFAMPVENDILKLKSLDILIQINRYSGIAKGNLGKVCSNDTIINILFFLSLELHGDE